MDAAAKDDLLRITDLTMHIESARGTVRAVDGISLRIAAGEAVAVVGESGSGKSLTALTILNLVPPLGRIKGGEILFNGRDLLKLSRGEMQALRGGALAAIFQDPMTFLNPVMRVGDQIMEAILLHQKVNRQQAEEKTLEALRLVRIPTPERVAASYPHQLSGGMRQRVLIAIAISCTPELLIADEPTTALDVTIQAQIMNLLQEIRAGLGSSLLLITHDFGIVAESCDRVYVMYVGELVEHGDVVSLFERPRHPYTKGLLSANLSADRRVERFETIKGQVANLINPPKGCRFHPRCPYVMDICRSESPPAFDLGEGNWSRCWLHNDPASAARLDADG